MNRDPEEVALEIADGLHQRLEGVLWAPESNPPMVIAQYDGDAHYWYFYAASGTREVASKLSTERLAEASDLQIEEASKSLEQALTGGKKEVKA